MKKIILSSLLLLFTFSLFAVEDSSSSDSSSSTSSIVSVQLAMSNPDYMVTPGDIYTLSYAAGNSAVSYSIPVDTSYKIRISNLAVIDVKGKTFPELKATVENIVSKNYPMSGVQFVLKSPSTFKVTIKGEVISTFEVSAWSLSRLSSLINNTQNTEYSSSRFVTVTNAEGKSTTYDLFQFSRYGDFSQNPYIRPGDVITINRAHRKVNISGAVERNGTYELKDDENLITLINYYGNGLSPLADTSKIQLTRYLDSDPTSGKKIYLSKDYLAQDYNLHDMDEIFINSYKSLSHVVFLEGAVMTSDDAGTTLDASSKITVSINEDTNYTYFIRGIKNYFGNPQSDLQNAYILRDSQILPLNIDKILYDPSYYVDITVEANDKVVVPFRQFFVTVAGSVISPGRFPYIPNRTYDYYIGLAGGFNVDRNKKDAVTIVDANGNKLKKDDFITPECTITASTNSFYYYFYRYAGIITEIATILTAAVTVKALIPTSN